MGSEKEELEEAFRLIKEGNDKHDKNEYWHAADCYSQAQLILTRLSTTTTNNNNNVSAEQQAKITNLYKQQATDYLKQARMSLIEAMQNEINNTNTIQSSTNTLSSSSSSIADNNNNNTEMTGEDSTLQQQQQQQQLTDDECMYRMKLFGRLFAKEPEDVKTLKEQESSLEERLHALSNSIPSNLKSEKERMRDLNKGLARLGLSLFSPDGSSDHSKEQKSRLYGVINETNKSEIEQVDDIIAQAKDEVQMNGLHNNDTELAEAAASGKLNIQDTTTDALIDQHLDNNDDIENKLLSSFDEDDDVDVEDIDSDNHIDADLSPDICRNIHEKLATIQVSLAELIVLFEVDQDNNAEIEFDQIRGKKLLKDSIQLLCQIQKKWNEC